MSIRLIAHEPLWEAIASTAIGDTAKLILGQIDGADRVVVVNSDKQLIGIVPADEPIVPQLIGSPAYRARVSKIVRGRYDQRFKMVIVDISRPVGDLAL